MRRFRGLHWGLLLVMSLIVASVCAQAPKGTPGKKRDTSPIRPTIPTTSRNQAGKVFLERADVLKKGLNDDYQIVVGNVEFRRLGMFMYCDSAHFYDGPGNIEAFGNVRMRQGDTLFVDADWLEYTDSTKLAVLYADFGKKVKLRNRDVTLTTDVFNYDLGIDLGYYEVGGVLTDPKNRLTSWYGEYSPTTKDALFREDVKLHSLRKNDTLDIVSEQMLYNTNTHIAYLDTTSTIYSKDGTIFTKNGTYNTDTQAADLYDRSLVVAKNGNTLQGDTLYYDQQNGIGEAFGNIELVDTAKKVTLYGDIGYYFENVDSARVYGHALAKEYSQKDTLYLHGDTILTYRRILLPPSPDPPAEEAAPAAEAGPNESNEANEEAPAAPLEGSEPAPAEVAEASAEAPEGPAEGPLESSAEAPEGPVAEAPESSAEAPESPAEAPLEEPAAEAPAEESSTTVAEAGAEAKAGGTPPVAPEEAPEGSPAESPQTALAEKPAEQAPLAPEKAAPLALEPAAPADTVHYIVAAPRAKFYRVDLQGLCDSMTFVSKDSLLYLDRHPVVWNENKQIFGNEIIVHLNDSTVDWAKLPNFGFVAEHIDDEFYNQLTGKEMFATFVDGKLHHLDVSGNVQAIMLPQENDSTYNKIANLESSYMAADFLDQQLQRMKLWPETSGTMTPLYLAKKQLYYLPQFRWFEPLRPLKPEDVFEFPQELIDLFNEPPFGSSRR